MKFFHLSDLHIGKQLHHYNLKEDQEAILNEVISYAKSLHPDAVIIAGDIYDKSVPSGEAVSVFDAFLTKLTDLTPAIPVLLISGNHDSAERLEFASAILKKHAIHIAGKPPMEAGELMKHLTLADKHGPVHIYMLPFLKPGMVRGALGGELPKSYEEAVERILANEEINWLERNVFVSHQFYTAGGHTTETCESETLSVGGIDNVDTRMIQDFDYTALGHIHGPQSVGVPHIRYCGTLLKYSVSEYRHEKSLTVVTLGAKGEAVHIDCLPLHPIRDVRKKVGLLADVLAEGEEENPEDYVSVTLTDEVEPYRPKEQLEAVYSHILEVRVDNTRTRKKLEEFEEEITFSDPLTAFGEFYKEVQGRELSEEEYDMVKVMIEDAEEESI